MNTNTEASRSYATKGHFPDESLNRYSLTYEPHTKTLIALGGIESTTISIFTLNLATIEWNEVQTDFNSKDEPIPRIYFSAEILRNRIAL